MDCPFTLSIIMIQQVSDAPLNVSAHQSVEGRCIVAISFLPHHLTRVFAKAKCVLPVHPSPPLATLIYRCQKPSFRNICVRRCSLKERLSPWLSAKSVVHFYFQVCFYAVAIIICSSCYRQGFLGVHSALQSVSLPTFACCLSSPLLPQVA